MALDYHCLSGRNAVVVGASSGINLGVAHRLGSLAHRSRSSAARRSESPQRPTPCAPMVST
jgi:NAD(P)-dependent dehydrogenase (short-subunit alcohol dehydrogenase family)